MSGENQNTKTSPAGSAESRTASTQSPTISLPTGGGAIRPIGEKFSVSPATGTASFTVPVATSPARNGFQLDLQLTYDSGSGNGPFGIGWTVPIPAIARKTDKGVPRYDDATDSDVFILSGAEDLVPVRRSNGTRHEIDRVVGGATWRVRRYRPRTEGLFARIERWTDVASGDVHWRTISRENVTSLYGLTLQSRVGDPADRKRVFSWLLCETFDDRGNAILYDYKTEDDAGVDRTHAHERNRTTASRSAARYPKRIRYGNRISRLVDPQFASAGFHFEVVFDYGEHDPDAPTPQEQFEWLSRHDPHSTCRGGFEVRTYRLCRRILMFHHFPGEAEVGADCIVRSTDLVYRDDALQGEATGSLLASITQRGWRRKGAGYLSSPLPPIELQYSRPEIQSDVRELDAASLENLPVGADGNIYQWVDLDGEGSLGILTQQAEGWYYKRNLSALDTAPRFGPTELVANRPAAPLGAGVSFMDLAGDGQMDMVLLDSPAPGFYERNRDATDWTYRVFESSPQVDLNGANARFIDLDGDGLADLLITEDDAFFCFSSLGEAGFASPTQLALAADEEQGPRLIFDDGTQSIYIADMSGDGLSDIVRIRRGEVSYWSNLGHGYFGAKVSMDDAPPFDDAESFDQRRIRLGDIDGSGPSDLFYLHAEGVRIWRNLSGNGWSAVEQIDALPPADNLASVTVVDLLGNGTSCLVWSSPLPQQNGRPLRYVDLMGGRKPHLLVSMANNLGAETRVHYAPSTFFYLRDRAEGRPWFTRLPFPVHVVESVETFDHVSGNRFVTRYDYHHGYFDGEEREFRGFGMVEHRDTEEFAALLDPAKPKPTNVDVASHVPPVRTKTWYHTGAFTDADRLARLYATEYYHPDNVPAAALESRLLGDTIVSAEWSAEESRQACRALRGSMLRQEIYADDGSPRKDIPYGVTESSYTITRVQSLGAGRHAVFYVNPRETIELHHERNAGDPRTAHTLTLEVDDFGNVLKSAHVAYPRHVPDLSLDQAIRDVQSELLALVTFNRFTNAVDSDDDHRTPVKCETRAYQMSGVAPQDGERFTYAELTDDAFAVIENLEELAYEQLADTTRKQRRIVEHDRLLYRTETLATALPLGQIDRMALPFETYRLAFTPGLLASYSRQGQALLPAPAAILRDEGGYLAGDDQKAAGLFPTTDVEELWWTRSGQTLYSPDTGHSAAQELAFARQHFFLPHRWSDAFGNTTTITYDHDLLMLESRDPLGSTVTAGERDATGTITSRGNDFRVLKPRVVMDPNRNRAAVAFDVHGRVAGTALMGKPEENLGDSLDQFEPDPPITDVIAQLESPAADPHAVLKSASTRVLYDLFAFHRTRTQPRPSPIVSMTLARDTHSAGLPSNQTGVQHTVVYSDGLGRELQKKMRAESGPLVDGGPDIAERWIGSGWTVFNNKGKPVRQYEPFFSATATFESDRRVGVSRILFYDPLERVVGTVHPSHTFEKVVFDAWREVRHDVNDTIRVSPADDPDIGSFFRRLDSVDYLPTWYDEREDGGLGGAEQRAAMQTKEHENTPTTVHLDPLGRIFATILHNGFDGSGTPIEHATRVVLDIEGKECEVVDALGRLAMHYGYDVVGRRIRQSSIDAGERLLLHDVGDRVIREWTARGPMLRTVHDELRRPIELWLEDGVTKQMVGRTAFGNVAAAETGNRRGRVVETDDGAGAVFNDEYDFKGNLRRTRRRLAVGYHTAPDWSQQPALEPDEYERIVVHDALNRPVSVTVPDGTIITPAYNEANLLERIEANVRGAATATTFIADIDYDAKGQRTHIEYGNGVHTHFTYDDKTFRLRRLVTTRGAAFASDCPDPANACGVQNLHYTYDASGNVTEIADAAQQTVYFAGAVVSPECRYTYDALNRLITASGREHRGQLAAPQSSWDDAGRTGLHHPHDGQAMRRYDEAYDYDAVGNLMKIVHQADHGDWTRRYEYAEPSPFDATVTRNHLTSTKVGTSSPEVHTYDAAGNITAMGHLPLMRWDHRDRLEATSRQVHGSGVTPEITYYVYDTGGSRVRKVTESAAVAPQTPRRMSERIYLDGVELYREYAADGSTVTLERETLHIDDAQHRFAMVETRTHGNDGSPQQLTRFQHSNQLGSAALELDATANVISYEEYHPWGSTSYQALASAPKRYRYTGMERDEESGLSYHHARYYAPWLGRWTSCDPKGLVDADSLYVYGRDNPLGWIDREGEQSTPAPPAGDGKTQPRTHVVVLGHQSPGGGPNKWLNQILNVDTPESLPDRLQDGDRIVILSGDTSKELLKELKRTIAQFEKNTPAKEGKPAYTVEFRDKAKGVESEMQSLSNVATFIYVGHGITSGPLAGIDFPDASKFESNRFTNDAEALWGSCNLHQYAEEFTKKTGVKSTAVEGTSYFGEKRISAGKLTYSSEAGTSKTWIFTGKGDDVKKTGPKKVNILQTPPPPPPSRPPDPIPLMRYD